MDQPSFSLNQAPELTSLPSVPLTHVPIATLDRCPQLDPTLRTHLYSIKNLTSLLNKLNNIDNILQTKLNPNDYSDIICLRLHRLLDYAPLLRNPRELSPIDDLVHLSLVVMTTLMPEYGHNQARYDLLATRMRDALRRYTAAAVRNKELFLWAVFVGYATVLPESGRDWLALCIREVCERLDLNAWADVREILCQYA